MFIVHFFLYASREYFALNAQNRFVVVFTFSREEMETESEVRKIVN